jgi:hypothetical protein
LVPDCFHLKEDSACQLSSYLWFTESGKWVERDENPEREEKEKDES